METASVTDAVDVAAPVPGVASDAFSWKSDMAESSEYLSTQLITYLGNKRALLDFIGRGVNAVRKLIGRDRLVMFDAFSGSGVVSRYFRQYASRIHVNDIEEYAEVISRCYMTDVASVDLDALNDSHSRLRAALTSDHLRPGFIADMYAPRDDSAIVPGERCFYTRRNAMYLDTARMLIGELPASMQPLFLAPLLAEASIHANTSGVFKGFYKDASGVGRFGGHNRDALTRILGEIHVQLPVFSRFSCESVVHRGDAADVAAAIGQVDLAYIDPPYNQHPYGSNYFMLDLLTRYERPEVVSTVSGIPENWQRSAYNARPRVAAALATLLDAVKARFLLVSFNSEGFISRDDMVAILSEAGRVDVLETRYNTFRGSRNLRKRDVHVKEYLYLVDRR